jgi:hypothetical protein
MPELTSENIHFQSEQLKVGTACLTASEQKQSRKFSSGGSRERKLS